MSERVTIQTAFSPDSAGLKDVSLITTGIEAIGHGLFLDEKTAETGMKLMLGRAVKSYLRHSGSDGDRLGDEIGYFSGIYRKGNQIKASAFEFLESFKRHAAEQADKLMEMARKLPEQFGVSLVFEYEPVWVMCDGTEVPAIKGASAPKDAIRPIPSVRMLNIVSADFVGRPAANPTGLFSADGIDAALSTSTTKTESTNAISITMTPDSISLSKHTEEITSLSTQHKDAVVALETKHKEAVTALEAKVNEGIAQLAVATESVKSLTAALAAKTHEAEESAKYDMRKAGGEALSVALQSRGEKIPEPAATDAAKWEQYAALCKPVLNHRGDVIGHDESPAAKRFKDAYLTRK